MADEPYESSGVGPAVVDAAPLRPDNLTTFRLARLALLLDVVPGLPNRKPLDVERLGYYDFFADNPFLVFGEKHPLRKQLVLAGFDSRNLSYQSSAQRFTNRRARLQHDLALLVARGLVGVATEQRHVVYSLTEDGHAVADDLGSMYAAAYRRSAELVGRELNRLSDAALRQRAKEWLAADELLIDLYDADRT